MLKPGETILYRAKIHRFCYFFPFLLLVLGLTITFAPQFAPNPQSRFYPLQMQIESAIETVKAWTPEFLWPYVVTFQALRTNYLALMLLTVGGIRMTYAFVYRNFSRFWVTDQRIIAQVWIFHERHQEIQLDKISAVKINYGNIGLILNRGVVTVHDFGMQEIELRHLARPRRYKEAIEAAAQAYRTRPFGGGAKKPGQM